MTHYSRAKFEHKVILSVLHPHTKLANLELLYYPPFSRPIRELLLSSHPIRNGGEYWLRSKVPRNLSVTSVLVTLAEATIPEKRA